MAVVPITAARSRNGEPPHPASILERLTSYLTLRRMVFNLHRNHAQYEAPQRSWLGTPPDKMPNLRGLTCVTVRLSPADIQKHLMGEPSTSTLAEVFQQVKQKPAPPLIRQELELTEATLNRFAGQSSAPEPSLGPIEKFLCASLGTPAELPLSIYFEDGEPKFMVGLTAKWIFRDFLLETQGEHDILRCGKDFIVDFYVPNTSVSPVFRIIQRIPQENTIISVKIRKIGQERPLIIGGLFTINKGDCAAEYRGTHSIDDLTKAEILAYSPAVTGILKRGDTPQKRSTSPAARKAIGARRGREFRVAAMHEWGPDGESQIDENVPEHEVRRIQAAHAQLEDSRILILESARGLLEILNGIGALPPT